MAMLLCLQSDITMMCSQACSEYKECRIQKYYNCQYLVGGNVAGAPASTEVEMKKTIYTLVGDGMAPTYDLILPDTHRCKVEERKELSKEVTCTVQVSSFESSLPSHIAPNQILAVIILLP